MSVIAETPPGKAPYAIMVVNDAFSSAVDLEFSDMSRPADTASVCLWWVWALLTVGQCIWAVYLGSVCGRYV